MASNPALEIASTIQTAHINRAPSPTHDINPSTAASVKIPVDIIDDTSSPDPDDILDDASLPSDIVLQPRPRQPPPASRRHMPLPDLRFEQTYLASLSSAQSSWDVAWITIKDQVFWPLVQGIGWHMIVFGWRAVNTGSKFRGQGLGAKVRRWWWEVNGWKVPDAKTGVGAGRGEFVRKAQGFYVDRFGSSMGD